MLLYAVVMHQNATSFLETLCRSLAQNVQVAFWVALSKSDRKPHDAWGLCFGSSCSVLAFLKRFTLSRCQNLCACVSSCLCQTFVCLVVFFFLLVKEVVFSLLLSKEHVDIWETDKFVSECIPRTFLPCYFFHTLETKPALKKFTNF